MACRQAALQWGKHFKFSLRQVHMEPLAPGRVMLVSTHNLGSVPEFCDRTVLVKGTVLAHGPTETTFTRENLENAFGGILRHFTLGGDALHDDDDGRSVTIFTDDERPLVQYGDKTQRTKRGK